jgi:hypothetical protein
MDPKKLERLKTLSLLYVEDDAATRDELAQILEVWLGECMSLGTARKGWMHFCACILIWS